MLIAYIGYILQSVFTILINLLKKGFRPPDYVIFTLHGPYTDLKPPPEGFLQRRMRPRLKSIQELQDDFRTIARNPRIKGIIVSLAQPELTLPQIQSLIRAIREIQDGGKEVIAWATSYHPFDYCLAAAADRILLQKGGVIYALGFANRQLYMKNALDWCGLQLDAVQISPYKSAMERFTRSDMSDEVREMTNWLMDSYFRQFIDTIAAGRKLGEEQAHQLIEQTPLFGEEAVKARAVDAVISAEDLPPYLGSEEKPARLAGWEECARGFMSPLPPPPGRYIAVLRIQGNIVDGKSRRPPGRPPAPVPFLFSEQTGDLSFVQQARRVLRDKRARAVLLYIDSGGGSAVSSEAMSAILEKIAAQKPLVAMMGSIAGSGGYYVATPAAHIVAQPATITGSIGVITAKIVDSGLLERLLLNRETFQRGKKELFTSPEAPFTDEEREKARELIDYIYELFTERVAGSRGLSKEAVKEVGGGKVWTGQQALEHGLIDELGGLETALAKLRSLTGLPDNTPLVDIPYPRRDIAPLPDASGWIAYALSNLAPLQDGRVLLAGPLYFMTPVKKI